jgi:hypothetical protein
MEDPMILLTRGAGCPRRIDHALSIVAPTSLDQVVAAIAVYAESGGATAYVERVGERYRWSPAVKGGPYPLTRVVARFLECRHTEITVGFITVDGWCIVGDPEGGPPVDDYAVLGEVAPDIATIEALVQQHLAPREQPQ